MQPALANIQLEFFVYVKIFASVYRSEHHIWEKLKFKYIV